MISAITIPNIQRKPELLGHGIHNEHCIGIGVINEQRRNRTEEL
jgi:hypothetical protein